WVGSAYLAAFRPSGWAFDPYFHATEIRMRSSRSSGRPTSRLAVLLAVLAVAAPAAAQDGWNPVPDGYPRTAAEVNGFSAHTRHLEMWDYLEQLRDVAPNMRLGTYGETREGRKLAYAVFSNPLVSEPWEAMALGRPILVLAANVHGGERTF